jgi:hypothetical protein
VQSAPFTKDNDPVGTQRDAALRRVGRNVVNFQHLENTLRTLVSTMRLSGPMGELASKHAMEVKSLKKRTLGDLASRFHDRMLGTDPVEAATDEPIELAISLSVRYELDPTLAADIKRKLLSLVQERNRLIHRDLVQVDFNSIEACKNLSVRLDEQNDRINKQLLMLKTIRDGHLAALQDLAAFVASEEFAAQLGRDAEDA